MSIEGILPNLPNQIQPQVVSPKEYEQVVKLFIQAFENGAKITSEGKTLKALKAEVVEINQKPQIRIEEQVEGEEPKVIFLTPTKVGISSGKFWASSDSSSDAECLYTETAYNEYLSDLESLPIELIETIFFSVNDKDLVQLQKTSKSLNDIIKQSYSLRLRLLSCKIKKKIESANYRTKVDILNGLNELAKAQAKNGNIADAKRTFQLANTVAEAMKNPQIIVDSLISIAKAQAESGDIGGAEITVKPINKPYDKVKYLIEIAKAQAKSGNSADAKRTFQLAKTELEAIILCNFADEIRYEHFLSALAKAQAESGDIEGAQTTAKAIEMPQTKAEALAEIAKVQVKSEDSEGAQTTSEAVLDPKQKVLELLTTLEKVL